MTPLLRHFSALAAFTFLAVAALAPSTAHAQVVFEDFDDGNVDNASAFFGNPSNDAGAGVGPTDDRDGTADAALNLGVDPGSGEAFAGFAVEAAGTGVDASGAEYFTFYVRPTLNADNVPVVLEVNLQEDADGDGTYDGATEDEYQATVRLDAVGGQPYSLVQLPLSAFTDDNSNNVGSDDGFDFSRVKYVVMALGGLSGSPFAISFDDLGFATGVTVANELGGAAPERSLVSAAYPNPFVGQTRVDVTLNRAEQVRVEVFDVLGRRVLLLHEGQLAGQTPHTFRLNGRDLISGIYLVRVMGETFAQTRRVVLAK
jgi:hypothetical protein